jgi:hypothetical protein
MELLSAGLLNPAELLDESADGKRPARNTCPGTASKYYPRFSRRLRQAVKDGQQVLLVVIYCRVSSDKQRQYGNINHQPAKVKRRLDRLGRQYGITIQVVDEFLEEGVSAALLWKGARPKLDKAAKLARKRDAVLVALNTSRFVRNKQDWRDTPRDFEFEDLMSLVGNAKIATLHHPDENTDSGDGKSADIKRGQKAKNATPGRPKNRTAGYKKRRYEEKIGLVMFLHQRDWSVRDIANKGMVSVPSSTVGDWIRKAR